MADHVTDAFDYLREQLLKLEPGTQWSGTYADKPGYHNTRSGNSSNNYSVTDAEDRGGPDDKAAAIDWTFPEAHGGDYSRIKVYSRRLLDAGRARDPRLEGWREFYGNADDDTHVEGYDFRYHETASSDSSHLWHIHLSCDRDRVTDKANMDALLGVLRGEDDMALSEDDIERIVNALLSKKLKVTEGWLPVFPADPGVQDGTISYETALKSGYFWTRQAEDPASAPTGSRMAALEAKVDQILAALAGGQPPTVTGSSGTGTFTWITDPPAAPPGD